MALQHVLALALVGIIVANSVVAFGNLGYGFDGGAYQGKEVNKESSPC